MKVMVIGIDGLDIELINKFEKELPNFRKLKEQSPDVKLFSVFPPDSPTAWASIYTGKNPAEHGFVFFRDPFTDAEYGGHLKNNVSGKTFWDDAGKRLNKKVCILFPHGGYPAWPVNGVMIGRTTEVDIKKFDIDCWPEELETKYDFSGLKPLTSYPVRLGDMIEPTKDVILNEVALGLKLYDDIDWDLFFYYSSSIDNIQHLFWMYNDKDDPFYEEGNPYENVILDFYKFYDRDVIGPFLNKVDEKTALIVLSDHGHAMRPVKVVNINEILRRNGFLKLKEGNSKMDALMTNMKGTALSLIDRYRFIGKLASRVLRMFPRGLELYVNTTPINGSESICYLSDPSGGVKSYSYAGIRINRNLASDSYESIRDDLIELLLSIRGPEGEKLVEWAIRREDLYRGDHIAKYPDIIFKLDDEWGVGWDVNGEIFSRSNSHRLHSGNHRAETPVFFVYNADLNVESEKIELMNVSSIILDLLEH